jgi:hypothetical protein
MEAGDREAIAQHHLVPSPAIQKVPIRDLSSFAQKEKEKKNVRVTPNR